MRCTIWYYICNFKIKEKTHGEVLTKSNTSPWVFSRSLVQIVPHHAKHLKSPTASASLFPLLLYLNPLFKIKNLKLSPFSAILYTFAFLWPKFTFKRFVSIVNQNFGMTIIWETEYFNLSNTLNRLPANIYLLTSFWCFYC